MVRPIEEEAMTALNDTMRILEEVGEQVNGSACRSCQLLEVHDLGEAERQCAEANDAQFAEL